MIKMIIEVERSVPNDQMRQVVIELDRSVLSDHESATYRDVDEVEGGLVSVLRCVGRHKHVCTLPEHIHHCNTRNSHCNTLALYSTRVSLHCVSTIITLILKLYYRFVLYFID